MKIVLPVAFAVLLGGCTIANSSKCGPGYVYHWLTTLCLAPGESRSIQLDPADMPRGNPTFPVYISR